MADHPYTLLSCCVSLDGYLDSPTRSRLALSNGADFDRVDGVRATCDAVLVGAATIRNDNPRLLVRSPEREAERIARGQCPSPVKVTVTARAELDPASNFFTCGTGEKLVYCAGSAVSRARWHLGGTATVIDAGEPVDLRWVSEDLGARGVQRLMVEGGGTVLTQFLTADLADELQLAIAPFFVGEPNARRLVGAGDYPWNPDRRATLAQVRQLGDVVLLRYALSPRFDLD